MGGFSTWLIITGVFNGIIGFWLVGLELNPERYFYCMGDYGWYGDSVKLMNCTYLFVGNTLPAFLIIVGIIAKITGR